MTEINYDIRWIVIYPVDNAIQRLNNRGQEARLNSMFQLAALSPRGYCTFYMTGMIDFFGFEIFDSGIFLGRKM